MSGNHKFLHQENCFTHSVHDYHQQTEPAYAPFYHPKGCNITAFPVFGTTLLYQKERMITESTASGGPNGGPYLEPFRFDEPNEVQYVSREIHVNQFLRRRYDNYCCTHGYGTVCVNPSEQHKNQVPIYNPAGQKGHKKFCPICARSEAQRSATKTFHELHAFKWKNLRKIVLTTPSDFVKQQDYENEDMILQSQETLTKLANQYMKKVHCGEPYILWFHHWHSKIPLSPPHFHVHILSSCTLYQKGSSFVKRLSPVLSEKQLSSNRAIWQGLIGHESDVNINYSYHQRWFQKSKHKKGKSYGGAGRLKHHFTYNYRSYIQDVNVFLGKEGLTVLEDDQKYWLTWHMRQWKRLVRRYGAWSNTEKGKYIQIHRVERRIINEEKETSKVYCSQCEYLVEAPSRKSMTSPEAMDMSMVVRHRVFRHSRPPEHLMIEKMEVQL